MSFDETTTAAVRYDDDTETAMQSVTTTTAADRRKLESETMDPAPTTKAAKTRKGKAEAKAKTPATEQVKEYAVLNSASSEYYRISAEELPGTARGIEGDPNKAIYRLVPLKISINVEITE